jgi:hypothetical protein
MPPALQAGRIICTSTDAMQFLSGGRGIVDTSPSSPGSDKNVYEFIDDRLVG